MTVFPAGRYLRAARYRAGLSQRELAEEAGVSHSVVARIEHMPAQARVEHLATLLHVAGLTLIVVDESGAEFLPEARADNERRNDGGRRFPAHLDVRPGSEGWWGDADQAK